MLGFVVLGIMRGGGGDVDGMLALSAFTKKTSKSSHRHEAPRVGYGSAAPRTDCSISENLIFENSKCDI